MFDKVLIANRGEIALRIHRACKELGISTVAIHSTADSNAMHVGLADESVCVGPPALSQSYLNIPSILSACEITGVDAVHPGYGFLSENENFAQMVNDHGFVFIGPKPEHIRVMGDKVLAKETMKNLGVPCVPGSEGNVSGYDEAAAIAKNIGYPVLIKASGGGGGRGMRVVNSEDELADSISSACSEAGKSFGRSDVYLEKYLQNPKHIEIQIIADSFGNVVSLGERDCSVQRRHQKLIEEAPSTVLSPKDRVIIDDICINAVASIGYLGVGTIEFLYEKGELYFIEMNTRLQVEHPVTEAVRNIDLVQEQIKVASGERLSTEVINSVFSGHAIECRINAEDPRTFLPSPGKVIQYHPPGGAGVRIDSAVYSGYSIPPYYDSMIGKLIVHANTRKQCISKLKLALREFVIHGVDTTIPLLFDLIDEESFINGSYSVQWLENYIRNSNF